MFDSSHLLVVVVKRFSFWKINVLSPLEGLIIIRKSFNIGTTKNESFDYSKTTSALSFISASFLIFLSFESSKYL